MYVITGVMPYENGEHMINNRVVVPEYMRSAYCCPNHTPNAQFFPTYAAVGRNDPDSNNDIVTMDPNVQGDGRGYDVERMDLKRLEGILRKGSIQKSTCLKGCVSNKE
ncbi:endonuclease domain-containing 1 protein-like protein [Lates japonicus]|uniref:Endonuclease domain-containing 1 protein-like protein n=1 Tax=Lates japonicus TaxID=270547 RepID=A0AAD3RGC9_LATJO|nr:endonuclease domain-containing 1 protein-like protein [Lates japonicus]